VKCCGFLPLPPPPPFSHLGPGCVLATSRPTLRLTRFTSRALPLSTCNTGVGASGVAVGSVGVVTYSPTFAALSPGQGSVLGKTLLTVTGTGLSTSATVTIGGAVCTPVIAASSPSALVCSSPSGLAGAAHVEYNGADTGLIFQFSPAFTPQLVTFSPAVFSLASTQVRPPEGHPVLPC
jgi:hypothetical protein